MNNGVTSGEIEYLFTNEGVQVTSSIGSGMNYWNAFESYGIIEHYIFIARKDNMVILVDKNSMSDDEMNDLYNLLENNIEKELR